MFVSIIIIVNFNDSNPSVSIFYFLFIFSNDARAKFEKPGKLSGYNMQIKWSQIYKVDPCGTDADRY